MYNRNELDSMAHGRVKKLAIAKAKQRGEKSSWIQTTAKGQLIDYILDGRLPKESPPPTPSPKPTPTPSPQQTTTSGSLEDMLANKVAEKLGDDIYNRTEKIQGDLIEAFSEQTDELSKKVDKKINSLQRPVTVYIDDVKVDNVPGLKHKQFPFVLECLKLFKRVWLCGPSGTGKSYLVEQCARALGFSTDQGNYEYLKGSAGVTESHMTGRMTFDGTFIDGSVSRSFREGSFLCLDEFDGFDSNAGLVFNSVFDNQGVLATPNDKENPFVTKDKNFHVAIASNTWGDGNDFDYAGRGQLDGATLDRMQSVKVYVDYDKNVERALAGAEYGNMEEAFLESS